jgi:thiamine-phosphate pyrophosphorylase
MKEDFWQLVLVTNKGHLPVKNYLELVELCVKAGITSVQLREKSLPNEDLLHFGKSLKNLLDSSNIPLIINDSIDLCRELDASGIHLGQSDGDPVKTRKILGPDKIIGLSVNTMAQVENSNSLPLDYIGLGAIFSTKNKPDIETIWGLDNLKKASLIASHPIVAIGGIDERNALSAISSGAKGLAAIGVFHDAADPSLTTQKLFKMMNEAYHAK